MASNQQNQSTNDSVKLEQRLSLMKHKLVVLSGKGGVGKSTVAANLALSLATSGKQVGLLDVDFHGPSIPKLLGLEGQQVQASQAGLEPIHYNDNLKMMSLGLMLQSQDDAVIWRGPMKMHAIKQLLQDVNWGRLDYLIVDCPPGTGDEPLSIVQLIKNVTGAVIVTTPQDLSLADVRKSIRFCEKLNMPVLGVIENMSGFVCPHCGRTADIFKTGGGEKMAGEMGVPFLGRIPIEPDIVTSGDEGKPYVYAYAGSETAQRFESIVAALVNKQAESTKVQEQSKREPDKGNKMTTYAIPTANGELCLHFGHCEAFAFIEVDEEKKEIVKQELRQPPQHQPGVLPRWLAENDVDYIIAGGMGSRAKALFAENNIQVITGAGVDKPENVVSAHLQGTLQLGENVCDH